MIIKIKKTVFEISKIEAVRTSLTDYYFFPVFLHLNPLHDN